MVQTAPSGYTLPRLQWLLVSISEGDLRCQVGQAGTAEALLDARDTELEGALWIGSRYAACRKRPGWPGKAGTGLLQRRYTAIAEETERALTLLGDRLFTTARRRGEAG
nr:hypothetical protein [Mycobacterium colombiense]